MDEIEIPQYFICPISLQIMKDPVTMVTGITYDRESIEQWLFFGKNTTCPVTKQPLPKDSDLTPNHTLRRLIQAWCIANASNGVDQIPTPKSLFDRTQVVKLIQELRIPQLQLQSLRKLEAIASRNEKNRGPMVEAGVAKAMVSLIMSRFREARTDGLSEAFSVFHLVCTPTEKMKKLVSENYDVVESIMWVLQQEMDDQETVKTRAVLVLKTITEVASGSLMERLKPEFFKAMVGVLRQQISQQATKAALHMLLEACPWGRNRSIIIEAGAVFDLIEIELRMPEKRTTELIFGILDHLCCSPDGRAQLLGHSAGIAMVSKRILRVSPAVDDRAVHILSYIAKFSGNNEVVHEMLRVGAVSKLCMVLQAECSAKVKEKARGVLRLHSNVWNNSPCIAVYLLTRHPR
ncbi:PREDICTED: E3 ubiquitin-protein ligase PUB24-like [Nelumbo nucifera]|uniref:U-box domain-containing protein n=1 Tax=Nelumbo nucifera TaxID=4432 RepID=A0A1U8AKB2_NELNU|nr:PREDICTED: E3 ubiquitin-protein ligase PUB24-like [Nelumbo nucifera]